MIPSMPHNADQSFLKKVGRKISEIRSQKGYTQMQLAAKTGISIQMVQYLESGRNITLKTLYHLSQHLNHPVHGFLQEPENMGARRGRPRKAKPE